MHYLVKPLCWKIALSSTLITGCGFSLRSRRVDRVRLDQRSCSTLSVVTSWMVDCIRAGELSHYVTNHPGQLSLLSLRGRQRSISYTCEGKGSLAQSDCG